MVNCANCRNEKKLCCARDHWVCLVANKIVASDKNAEECVCFEQTMFFPSMSNKFRGNVI